MTTWTLIIFIYAGFLAKGDEVALSNVSGFTDKSVCEAAGDSATSLTNNTQKSTRYVCVEVR